MREFNNQCGSLLVEMNLLAYATSECVYVIDGETHEQIMSLTGLTQEVSCLCFSACGGMLAAAQRGCGTAGPTVVWDVSSGVFKTTLEKELDIATVGFNGCGDNLLCRCYGGRVLIWSLKENSIMLSFGSPSLNTSAPVIRYSRDESQLLGFHVNDYFSDTSFIVFSAVDGSERQRLHGHDELIRDIAVHPNLDLVATCDNNGVVIEWNAADWNIIWKLRVDEEVVSKLAYSPDGSKLVVAGSECISVWDCMTHENLFSFSCNGQVDSLSIGSSGSRIALGYENQEYVCVFDLETRTELSRWEAEQYSQVCYSRALVVLM